MLSVYEVKENSMKPKNKKSAALHLRIHSKTLTSYRIVSQYNVQELNRKVLTPTS